MNAPVDFLKRPRQPVGGWVLLIAGVCAVASASWIEQRWNAQRERSEQANARLSAERQALRAPLPRPVPTAAQRRRQQAEVEIKRPWLPALRAVETATVEPVFLLSMVVDANAGSIRLEGEAQSLDDVFAYVHALGEEGVLRRTTLVSHEQVDDPAGGPLKVRFSATTQWATR